MKEFLCAVCAKRKGYTAEDIESKKFSHGGYCDLCKFMGDGVAWFDGFDKLEFSTLNKPDAKEGDLDKITKRESEVKNNTMSDEQIVSNDEVIRGLLEQIEGDASRLSTANKIIVELTKNLDTMRKMVDILHNDTVNGSQQKKDSCSGKCGGCKK